MAGEWRGCGSVRLPGGQFGRYRAGNLAGAVSLEGGVLNVGNLALDWGAPGAGGVAGTATVDFTGLSAQDTVAVTFQAGLREGAAGSAMPAVAPPGEGIMNCAGTLVVRPGAQRLQGKISGRLHPLRVYEALRGPLCLPAVAALSDIQALGPAPEFALELPDTPWTLEGWELRGQVSASFPPGLCSPNNMRVVASPIPCPGKYIIRTLSTSSINGNSIGEPPKRMTTSFFFKPIRRLISSN